MRRFIPALAAFTLAFAPVTTSVEAQAAPARVKGERCYFPEVERGTWVGRFDGYKEDPFISDGRDSYQRITIVRCFNRKSDCDAWKYWVQTDYPAPPGTAGCRKK